MLSKCANPSCSTSFRYMHEGKLFRFEVETQEEPAESAGQSRRRIEYYWLCNACCCSMSLRYEPATGVTTVPIFFLRVAS
jgi:hypothetical protein